VCLLAFVNIMQSLSSLIKSKQNLSPVWKGVEASLIVEKANEILISILGEQAINQAQAVYFKNKILTLACLSSVASQEVRLYEQQIRDKINDIFGPNTVEKLRYLA